MKIAILDDYQDVVQKLDCFSILKHHEVRVFNRTYSEPSELAKLIAGFEALVLIRERTKINSELLSKLPKLKLISQTGKVSNHINIDDCTNHNVGVAEGKGSPIAPSEFCWALIMSASRYIPQYSGNMTKNRWQESNLGLGRSLNGLTLGIWGYGRIGKRIAQYAKAFDMNVLIWGSESSRNLAQENGLKVAASKQEFFSSSDIVSLHLRLNEATWGVVTLEDLALMKSNSLFVNISRSALVQPGVLYSELRRVPSKRAAVDVFDFEPANQANEPLLSLPNVLCTPHLGYVEQNSYELYFKAAFENVAAFAEGNPQNLVNGDKLFI